MREIGILFSTPMAQAILDGRKTMTRRVIKPQPLWMAEPGVPFKTPDADPKGIIKCPYGQPGDLLYVKENTWIWCKKQRNGLTPTGRPKYLYVPIGQHVVYKLDHPTKPEWRIDDNPEHDWRMKVARFMPKWAARIWLERGETRVERLQDITEEDAKAEGVDYCCPSQRHAGWNDKWIAGNCHDCKKHDPMAGKCPSCFDEEYRFQWSCGCNFGFELRDDSIPEPYRFKFAFVWNDTALKGKGGPVLWQNNPWTWVVEFRRVER